MAINNFIPAVWAGEVLRNLHKAQVWAQPGIINRNYEGAIQDYGNTVRIGAIGPVTISTYAKNTQIGLPQVLADASTTMVIDQGDYFNLQVDDVDQAQARGDIMATAMYEAAYGISDKADKFVASLAVTNVAASNIIGTDAAPKSDLAPSSGLSRAYDYLVMLDVLLSTANVPSGDRFCVCPPWFHGMLRRDDRFIRYGTAAQEQVLTNGAVGEAAGFVIYKSVNNPITGTVTSNIVAGSPMAITYADQIVKTEAYRHPSYFADAVKGLHVYGAKVVRPQALAVLKAQDPGFS